MFYKFLLKAFVFIPDMTDLEVLCEDMGCFSFLLPQMVVLL